MATLSILDALKAMMISTNVRELLTENNAVWVGFGKKNSHILRTMLFKLFASSKLSKEAIIWIYFFHALIKDKDRIIMAYNTLPENLQNNEDIKEAIKFMRTKMVKYTKDETASKFASVHLPNTNPGMDIVLYLLSLGNHTIEEAQNKLDEVFKEVMARTTMTQIRLDSEMMLKNEEYVKDYWEKTVVYKNREERIKNKQAVGFVKEYYDTAAGDMYDLIDENFKIVKTKNSFYSEQDIVDYIFGVLTWKYREENQDDEGDDDDSGNDNKKNKGKEPEKQASKEKMKEFGPLLKKPTSPKTPRTIKPSTRK